MKIELNANLLGYKVGDYHRGTIIEIDNEDLEGMDEKEKEEFIEKYAYEYMMNTLEWGYEIEDSE